MDKPSYKPPLKRSRLSIDSSTFAFSNPYSDHSVPITDCKENYQYTTTTHAAPQQLHIFKAQLNQILELFPPFIDFMSSQENPDQLINELYHVFRSCDQPQNGSISYQHPPVQCNVHSQNVSTFPFSPLHSSIPNHIPPVSPQNIMDDEVKEQEPQPSEALDANTNATDGDATENTERNGHSSDDTTFDAECSVVFAEAKNKLMKKVHRNIELRCNVIIGSLNRTMTNNPKYCAMRKQFAVNVEVRNNIAHRISESIKCWNGTKCLKERTILNEEEAFKMVRTHWNRRKAPVLGDDLFYLVLHNLFQIVSHITVLCWKDKIMFYIDLFCGLLSDKIQFEKSMPRPLIPHACFDKSVKFKRLCENILDTFSCGTVKMIQIRSTTTCEKNGIKVTKYIRHGHRAKSLAESCLIAFQALKPAILDASNIFLQRSLQMHLIWLKQSCNSPLELIKWEMLPQHIEMNPFERNTNNHIFNVIQ